MGRSLLLRLLHRARSGWGFLVVRTPLSRWARGSHARKLAAHAPRLPPLAPNFEALVSAVRGVGVARIRLEDLEIAATPALLAAVDSLLHRWDAAAEAERPAHATRPERALMNDYCDIYLWGLDPRLLDLVETCLGLPPQYVGTDFKCERADSRRAGVRQWHRDHEDWRVVKVLIYLNEVTADGGPFEYVEGADSAQASQAMRYRSGYVPDADFDPIVPESQRRAVCAARHEVIVFDGAKVFHRARPPVSAPRYSVTFNYVSRAPLRGFHGAINPHLKQRLAGRLTQRQKSCALL
jgi:hypothetical protein